LIVALHAYCQIPFSKTTASNPDVIRVAEHLGRTPSSVARKLGNFGAFDPLLAMRGVSGLTHTSSMDRAVWSEFDGKWAELADQADRLIAGHRLIEDGSLQGRLPEGPSEVTVTTNARRYQAFFRGTVLASYDYRCALCQIDLPPLLVASHIVPWSTNESLRADPTNGICLCALHDRALDRALITVLPDLTVRVAQRVLRSRNPSALSQLGAYAGASILLPSRFAPSKDHLGWYNDHCFCG
jgi:hypothetical protein